MTVRKVFINQCEYYVTQMPKDRNGKRKILYAESEYELREKYDKTMKENEMTRDMDMTVKTAVSEYLKDKSLSREEKAGIKAHLYLVEEYMEQKFFLITDNDIRGFLNRLAEDYCYEDVVAIYRRIQKIYTYHNKTLSREILSKRAVSHACKSATKPITEVASEDFIKSLLSDKDPKGVFLYAYLTLAGHNPKLKVQTIREMTRKDIESLYAETENTEGDSVSYLGILFPKDLAVYLNDRASEMGIAEDEYLFNDLNRKVPPAGTTLLRYAKTKLFDFGLPNNVRLSMGDRNLYTIESLEKKISQFVDRLDISVEDKKILKNYMDEYKSFLFWDNSPK